jgi:hypothetical protein
MPAWKKKLPPKRRPTQAEIPDDVALQRAREEAAAAAKERQRLERLAKRGYDDEIEDDSGGGWFQEGRMANIKV